MHTNCAFKSALKMSCVCTICTKCVQARVCSISSSCCTLSAVELRQDHKACVCVSLTSSPKPLHVERGHRLAAKKQTVIAPVPSNF